MRIKHCGITYLDIDFVNGLSKTETGKKKLAAIGDYQKVNWRIINPAAPNRATRRKKINPEFGFMKNNAQDRTRHKRF